MKAILQRSGKSFVKVNNNKVGEIDRGLVVFLGVGEKDLLEDIDLLINKIINLRIFEDKEGKMNASLLDIHGEVLLISQFTLYADTRKGRRPNFIKAAGPKKALEYYNIFSSKLRSVPISLATGIFHAEMDVYILNDGPVTIALDTDDLRRST